MFIRNKFTIKQLPPCPPLELITVTLHCDVYRFCLSLLYRPPSLSVDVFGVLQHYYESINVSQFCSYVIIGDFNALYKNIIIINFLYMHTTHISSQNYTWPCSLRCVQIQ